ncbi:CopG protein [hydrothermal vent metagenome]|uniref:CopG protein n=1 Tax=hydrothermal vent metagenome TaxID=652676 RepID=A0A3B0ZBE7_9ZZZZ
MKNAILIIALSFMAESIVFAKDIISKEITVYKNPECGCCKKWVSYLKENNYKVIEKDTHNVLAVKKRLGVPEKVAACHTAVIDGYVIEGHVTNRDIKRLLLFRPEVKGIAVPGMPIGTPGMEQGNTKESYNVMSFDKDGNTKVYIKH